MTADQHKLLTTHYSDAITLANINILSNGVDDLIPMYEDLAGVTMNPNCTDCKLDMMIFFAIEIKKFEKKETKSKNNASA